MTIGAHHSARATTDEWLTPPHIVTSLGPFDLDPCAPPPERRLWATAAEHYHWPERDGLALPWFGRVWMNPPYGRVLGRWLERMAAHGNGIAMIFARTETRAFQDWVWPCCSGLLFLDGRVGFHESVTGILRRQSGAPSVLVAYDLGDVGGNADRLRSAGLTGAWFDARKGLVMVPTASWQSWRSLIGSILAERGPLSLQELYRAVEARSDIPPSNHNVRAKVRQTCYLYFRRHDERWAA